MSHVSDQIDSHIAVVTPENVAFHYEVAGPFRRLNAFLIDLMLRTLILIAAWMGVLLLVLTTPSSNPLVGITAGLTLVFWFVLSFFYGGLFEAYWNGQTPGKRMARLRVLSVDGQPINALQAVFRNILRDVDAMPFAFATMATVYDSDFISIWYYMGLYLIGLAAMMANNRYQRLGDLVCGTMVVVERRVRNFDVPQLDEPLAVELAALVPATFEVSPSLGRALAAYVQRRRRFAPNRRRDIARHLGEPLVQKFRLPPDTSHDLLLCALYHRTFFAETVDRAPKSMPAAELGVLW
jgi:uncharacterized RDD family membrane protein YckC